MIIEPTILAVGVSSFALHFIGKWKETTAPFGKWISNRESVLYWTTSTLLCFLSLLLQPDLSEAFGMKPLTYAAVMCYGGGHIVSRILGIKHAAAEKKDKPE